MTVAPSESDSPDPNSGGGRGFRVVCLLSGGIDSPVAAYMMSRRGAEVVLLHMDNRPYSDEGSIAKAIDMASAIEGAAGKRMRLFVAPHGRNQARIAGSASPGFQCVLCKALMLRVARGLSLTVGADAVVTGESLGQVASQTLHNIRAEEHGLDFPVLRPLIGLDKIEIEAIAKEIGTYGISIRPGQPCTAVPRRPVTRARLDRIAQEIEKVDMDELIRHAMEGVREIPRA